MHDSNELEGIWKETVAVEYTALFLYPDRKKGQKLGKKNFSRFRDEDANQGLSEYIHVIQFSFGKFSSGKRTNNLNR
jgi:hypothetical protein